MERECPGSSQLGVLQRTCSYLTDSDEWEWSGIYSTCRNKAIEDAAGLFQEALAMANSANASDSSDSTTEVLESLLITMRDATVNASHLSDTDLGYVAEALNGTVTLLRSRASNLTAAVASSYVGE